MIPGKDENEEGSCKLTGIPLEAKILKMWRVGFRMFKLCPCLVKLFRVVQLAGLRVQNIMNWKIRSMSFFFGRCSEIGLSKSTE